MIARNTSHYFMNLFGAQLRQAREAREMSLEFISFKSNIPTNVLEKLEQDDFASFYSASYVKSYLRKYSQFLELDLDDQIRNLRIVGYPALDSYMARSTVKESLESAEFSQKTARYQRAEKKSGTPIFLVGALCCVTFSSGNVLLHGFACQYTDCRCNNQCQTIRPIRNSVFREVTPKVRTLNGKDTVKRIQTSGIQQAPMANHAVPVPEVQENVSKSVDPLADL